MLTHAPACGKIPPHARSSIKLAGESWTQFLSIWDSLAAPDSDLLLEDFGPFYATFRLLQRLGVPFDSEFIAAVERINIGNRGRDDDPDDDGQDQFLDMDDPNADDSEYWETDAESGDEDECTGVSFSEATPAHFLADPAPKISRWSPKYNYHPVTGEPAGPGPAIGANLAEHAPKLAKKTERMALLKLVEPADRVRSKGGEITYIHGIPGPGDENRRYTP